MTPQEPQRSVEEELLVSTIYDWIDLGYVRSTVRELSEVGSSLHAAAMDVVTRLIGDGLVAAGDVTDGQFRPWDCTREEAIARIDREWQAAADPELWPFQVAALAPTEAGVEVVAHVLAREGGGDSWHRPPTQKPLAIVRRSRS